MTELYPFLAVRDVARAVDYYAAAFGATEEAERLVAPDGREVAVLRIGGCQVGVATEAPELGTPSPETVGATTVRVSLEVPDPDAVAAAAVAAGGSGAVPGRGPAVRDAPGPCRRPVRTPLADRTPALERAKAASRRPSAE